MIKTYEIEVSDGAQAQDREESFIGGLPIMPEDVAIPNCLLCGAQQTFFFQISFPDEHFWEGKTMVFFSCTSCAKKGYFIPKMLEGQLRDAVIPKLFLDDYQINFRTIIYDTSSGSMRYDYQEKIKYRKILLKKIDDPNLKKNKVGGSPNWFLEDESPSTLDDGTPMFFLMQFLEEYRFEINPSAPGQAVLGFDKEVEYSDNNYYELFLGNNIYFFGTHYGQPQVYVFTQI